MLRDARAVNDKVRLFAKLGAALIAAKARGGGRPGRRRGDRGRLGKAGGQRRRSRTPGPSGQGGPAGSGHARLAGAAPARPGVPRRLQASRRAGRGSDAARGRIAARHLCSGGRNGRRACPSAFSVRPGATRCWSAAERGHGAAHLGGRDLARAARPVRAGDIWVEGSRQWRAIEDQLIPPALFAAMRAAGPLPVAVPATAADYLAERRALLDRRHGDVAAKAAADTLEDVTIKGGDMKITPLKAVTPEAAEDTRKAALRHGRQCPHHQRAGRGAPLDRVRRAFTHQHTGMPADDPRVVLTGVLADATNLGLSRMADACSVASRRKLAWTAGWHLREDTYRSALAMLVNAQHSQPLAALFGAADIPAPTARGSRPPDAARPSAPSMPMYGREASALFYTHVSARHAPYHTVAIPPSGEAAHVIDGLLYHEADLSIAVHHTDGGGVSDHVFALAHLLGFRFAPRIPNLAERRLYGFGPASKWPALAPFIAGRADEKLITGALG